MLSCLFFLIRWVFEKTPEYLPAFCRPEFLLLRFHSWTGQHPYLA
nr:MAG TPA: hypothetical protein [Caudoviricetes sp.]